MGYFCKKKKKKKILRSTAYKCIKEPHFGSTQHETGAILIERAMRNDYVIMPDKIKYATDNNMK